MIVDIGRTCRSALQLELLDAILFFVLIALLKIWKQSNPSEALITTKITRELQTRFD
jgi:hypothetical protein